MTGASVAVGVRLGGSCVSVGVAVCVGLGEAVYVMVTVAEGLGVLVIVGVVVSVGVMEAVPV